MDDREALLCGIAAQPTDDLPRLVYADWLEDHDQAEQAAFIRAQVEAATQPAWEAFPVFCRHRKPEWHHGKPWQNTLPQLPKVVAEWPKFPFKRGLGWSLQVRQVASFLDIADELFRTVPIGQLLLPTATLDDWQRFVEQPWLGQIESIRFTGIDSPIEPIRLLCRNAARTNLKEVIFDQASRPAIPLLVEDLVNSPIGQQLQSLEFNVGPHDPAELFQALQSPQLELQRFRVRNFQCNIPSLGVLANCSWLKHLRELEIQSSQIPIAAPEFEVVLNQCKGLESLALRDLTEHFGLRQVLTPSFCDHLRAVDLSETFPRSLWSVAEELLACQTPLQSLRLRSQESWVSYRLARHWHQLTELVELDLRGGEGTYFGSQAFTRGLPPKLVACLLTRGTVDEYFQGLQDKFGDVICLSNPEQAEIA